jgi:serine protease Do
MAEAFGLEHAKGALVEVVQPNTPAAKAGLQRGDVIRSIDGLDIESVADLRLKVASMRPGTEVVVSIQRDGEPKDVDLILGSLDDPEAVVSAEDSPLEGIGLEPVTPQVVQEWDLEEESGILVTEVNPRSPYSQVLAEGMVILEVNDVMVESIGELNENLRVGRVNKLWVSFRGNRGYVALRVRRE